MEVSSNLEDYEVLSILGADLNSTCYKVRNKLTSKVFVWKAISYENFSETEKESLLSQIEKQKLLDHPHLLQVYDFILHEETKILYLVSEFCGNGNLSSLLQKCLIDNEYLNEDFLWQILYQIACTLKIKENLISNLSLSNVFVDADYKIKLFNSDILKPPAPDEATLQTVRFGSIIFELCTLQSQNFANKNFVAITKEILANIPCYYSNELKEIIKFMLTTSCDINTMVDAILCHPTVLIKLIRTRRFNVFVKNTVVNRGQQNTNVVVENLSNIKIETLYLSKLENFKNRETALKIREEKLAEKAHELHKREKKVALMERTVKEKMVHAELYLKRCRESRTASSGSNRSSSSNAKSYETLDTSLSADCGDSSIIMSTSSRMNSQIVKKPPSFVRTMSDRRVRFKGHSPLKDLCSRNNFKEPRSLPQQNSHSFLIKEATTVRADKSVGENVGGKSPKKSKSRKKLDLFSAFPMKTRKPLTELNVQNSTIYEETENNDANLRYDYRPTSWTEGSKQQAFDLLRIMNQGGENETIKHTYL